MIALLRLYHTVRYLKPVQIFGRVFYRLYQPKIDQSVSLLRREASGSWMLSAFKKQTLVGPVQFRFLNEIHEVLNRTDWNNPSWSKLFKT